MRPSEVSSSFEMGSLNDDDHDDDFHSTANRNTMKGGYRDDPEGEGTTPPVEDEEFERQLEDIDLPDSALSRLHSRTTATTAVKSKVRRFFLPCFVVVVVIIVISVAAVSTKRSKQLQQRDADLAAAPQKADSSDAHSAYTSTSNSNSNSKSSSFRGPKDDQIGQIVEFTVANLDLASHPDIDHCTYIQAHKMECSPTTNNNITTNNNKTPNNSTQTKKFRIQLRPSWAPLGVQRFRDLTSDDFWRDVRVFRVVDDFVSQFGLSNSPSVQKKWNDLGPIPDDDPVVGTNYRGTVTFATSGPNSRTTQIFINTANNYFLDEQGFGPIGEVLPAGFGYGGMEVVDAFYGGYGERPDQGRIREQGGEYLEGNFPKLSYFVKAEFVE